MSNAKYGNIMHCIKTAEKKSYFPLLAKNLTIGQVNEASSHSKYFELKNVQPLQTSVSLSSLNTNHHIMIKINTSTWQLEIKLLFFEIAREIIFAFPSTTNRSTTSR